MRPPLLAFVLVLVLAVAGSVHAAPTFEVLDRGTAIEVIARDVKAARTAVVPVRSRLEVEVTGAARAEPLVPAERGVKIVELAGSPRVLSVKLPLGRTDVKEVARHAQAIQVGPDLHLLFPRAVPARDAAVVLPEPTIPAALASTLPAIGPRPVERPLEARPAPAAAPAPPPVKPAAPPASAPVTTTSESSGLSLYIALGLAAIAAGVWLVRKRRGAAPAGSSIDVIAQRSLGPKAKVVWLAAGGREMVLAVTGQQVRMLGQWRKDAEPAGTFAEPAPRLPRARTHHEAVEPAATSSSVSGILKLRARGSEPGIPVLEPAHVMDDAVKTGDLDADALWAKEILAATARLPGRK